MKHSYADVIPLDRFSAGHVLPKSMAWDSEKLPLGLAPPTITILPFLSSSDGINMQVWPTLTPGALPLGIKEYLWTDKQFTEKKSSYPLQFPQSTTASTSSGFTYHIPSLGLSRGSSTGRNSMAFQDAVHKWTRYYCLFILLLTVIYWLHCAKTKELIND